MRPFSQEKGLALIKEFERFDQARRGPRAPVRFHHRALGGGPLNVLPFSAGFGQHGLAT